jgi:hypothetical protein
MKGTTTRNEGVRERDKRENLKDKISLKIQ